MSHEKLAAIYSLETVAGAPIADMNSSWVTKAYDMIDFLHLCAHLVWDDLSPTGTLTLEYTGDPLKDGGGEPTSWATKNVTNVDGSFQEQMYLDANLPISAFRLRFDYISGAANLAAFIVKKRG